MLPKRGSPVTQVSRSAPSASLASTPAVRTNARESRAFATTTALRQPFEDEVLAASSKDREALIADYTGVVDLQMDTTSLTLGEPDDAEAAELRDLTKVNRATFGHPLVMCVEHVADRSQFITQGWPA